jgi:uncharacterized membrane protein YcaP (DUF421 family)
MRELVGQPAALGWVAVKTLLLFVAAVAAFRLTERRTLARLRPFDIVVVVATGAIVGRTATSTGTPFLAGTVALVTLLLAHRAVTVLRRRPRALALFERRPRILVVDGRLQGGQLRRAGLTERDLYSMLRAHGVTDLAQVRYLIYESNGSVSVVPVDAPAGDVEREALGRASGPRSGAG